MPVRIKLDQAVDPSARVNPDVYYDWMPRSGKSIWETVRSSLVQVLSNSTKCIMVSCPSSHLLGHKLTVTVEKALAVLAHHPYLVARGVVISPYPLPRVLPLSLSPGRYIRPTQAALVPAIKSPNATERFMQQCPTPGELFDAVRSWGSVRQLRVWAETTPSEGSTEEVKWGARVEFWYEDEARRFQIGFGQMASLIKGWQV